MKNVEPYGRVSYAVQIEGVSERAAARRFGLDPRTVSKMMKFSVPPGYIRKKAPAKPKLDPLIPVIDDSPGRQVTTEEAAAYVEADSRAASGRTRLHRRHHDREGLRGGLAAADARNVRTAVHAPGHAQADFGEAIGIIGGVERKIHFFAFDFPHSDACFVVGYPAETTEAFRDGHVRAFAFFGGAPQSILYDNTKIAVARILGDGKRQRTSVFTELQSHYLFEDRFGRPGKGNDKGKVEGLVGYPYLPQADVAMTSAKTYLGRPTGAAS